MAIDQLLAQLVSVTPFLLVSVVVIAVALIRRDDGRWWKVLVAAGVMLALAQLFQVGLLLILPRLDTTYVPYWLLVLPLAVANFLTTVLFVVSAVIDRTGHRRTATRHAADDPVARD